MRRKSESPSSIKCYYTCPKKYEFKYLKKYPDPSGPAAELGNLFHKAAYASWHTQRWEHPDYQIQEMLKAMYSHPEIAALPHPKLVEGQTCEFQVDVDMGGQKIFGFTDLLLDEIEYAIDFKTSGKPWDEKKILENDQHIAYPLALRKMGRSKVKKFLYIVVTTKGKPKCQVITLEVSDSVCEGYRQKFLTAVRRIELDLFMPTPTQKECGWCPYKNICPAWQEPIASC